MNARPLWGCQAPEMRTLAAVLLCSCAGACVAFLPTAGPAARPCRLPWAPGCPGAAALQRAPRRACAVPRRLPLLRLAASDAAAPQDPQAMERLILDLSRQEDGPRRQRVAEMFGRALAGVNVGDQPPEFATDFQIALDKVGGEVQELARKKVLEQQEQMPAASEESAPEEGKYVPREKTAEELQVWALIDMMVQSKLLVSRATRPDSK